MKVCLIVLSGRNLELLLKISEVIKTNLNWEREFVPILIDLLPNAVLIQATIICGHG